MYCPVLPQEPQTGPERRCLERGRAGDLLRYGHTVADLQMLVFGRDAVQRRRTGVVQQVINGHGFPLTGSTARSLLSC
jgi:hypothetical protein